MTYARARLWLGITGVGSLVLLSAAALIWQLPSRLLSTVQYFTWTDVGALMALYGLLVLWLAPLDLLGGFVLPRNYRKSFESFQSWLLRHLVGALLQATLFVITGLLVLVAGRMGGRIAAIGAILAASSICLLIQWILLQLRSRSLASRSQQHLDDAVSHVQQLNIRTPVVTVAEHRDSGFTGSLVGFGKWTRIVIPEAWLASLSADELATVIARRSLAWHTGSYYAGIGFAAGWNITGFLLCSLLPGAGVTSVAELATTFCGFTIWTFVGLLTLPTASRRASLLIDEQLMTRGFHADRLRDASRSLDQMQDDEPHRRRWIETIFHPVPSVTRRGRQQASHRFAAWNVARTMLFLSWACFGFLSRAVHCNVGRPELWTVLPTD